MTFYSISLAPHPPHPPFISFAYLVNNWTDISLSVRVIFCEHSWWACGPLRGNQHNQCVTGKCATGLIKYHSKNCGTAKTLGYRRSSPPEMIKMEWSKLFHVTSVHAAIITALSYLLHPSHFAWSTSIFSPHKHYGTIFRMPCMSWGRLEHF